MQYKVLVVDDSKLARMVMASVAANPAGMGVDRGDQCRRRSGGDFVPFGRYCAGRFQHAGHDGQVGGEIRKASPRMPVAVVSANLQDETYERGAWRPS